MTKKRNDKGEPIFGLGKIPDHIIIKEQNIELGKLKSNIDELEFNLSNVNKKIKDYDNNTDEKLLKKVNTLQEQIKNLENKATNLNDELKKRDKSLEKKNKEIEDMKSRFVILNRKHDILQRESLQKLKDEK